MYDVIIIGAGPAGTAAGFDLVSAGYAVLMLDRRSFPRTKACAGGITPKALNLFAYDISHLVERQCHRVRVKRPGGHTFTVAEKQPLCHMVQRRDLDLYSLNKAISAGVEYRRVKSIKAIIQSDNHVRLNTEDGHFTARYLIGADGANSRVRRMVTTSSGRRFRVKKYPALEADVPVGNADRIPMELDFSREIPGYYWIFPKKDHVSIGIYATTKSVPVSAGMLQSYAKQRFNTCEMKNIKGYPICVGGGGWGLKNPGHHRVLLTGDAAGFAEPLLGEGIYFALKSGRTAAATIIRAIENRDSALNRYRRALKRTHLDLMCYSGAAKILYQFPGPCLKLAAYRSIHGHFSKGYARGLPLVQLFYPF
ncbi:MAG: geranylgeranyl reductase family protein [Desulfobacterales bacterium]|nr:geranylgeranyl reductase family protein [Desulfobacterales bacterium]